MALLKEIAGRVTESDIQEHRFNVVLKTKVGGFKLYLETNISAVSTRDAIQTVSAHLDKARAEFSDVLRQKWAVQTVTPIKPTRKMQHQRRMMNKK